MDFAILNIIQSAIFVLMDIYIVCRAIEAKKEDVRHRYFIRFAITVLFMQTFALVVRLLDGSVLAAPAPVQYIVFIGMFISMTVTSWGAVHYLLYLRKKATNLSIAVKILLLIPIVITVISAISSPWTHWLFYIDDSLHYHRGSLFFLQLCPFIYLVVVLAVVIVMLFEKGDKHDNRAIRYFVCFIVPVITGAILQLIANIDGGYTVIGVSVSLVVLYIEFYLEEIKEIKRLKEVEKTNALLKEKLEEIQELNCHLEENQAQLEESTSEQASQLEEIASLNDELNRSKDELERQLAIIGATSQRYFCAYMFDLKTKTFHEVFTLPSLHEALGSEGEIERPLELAWRHFVIPEDQEIMRKFHDHSRWNEYLKDKDSYGVEYRGVTSGWSKATIFAGKRENGVVTSVVYVLEQIHEQKKTEIQLSTQLAEIEELNKRTSERMKIVQSLGKVYFTSFFIDLPNDSFVEVTNIESIRQLVGVSGPAKSTIALFIENLIKEEFKESMRAFMDIETLEERMKGKTYITSQYIGAASKLWCQAYLIEGDRDENGKLRHVLFATRVIQEEKAIEEKTNRILEEAKIAAEAANDAKTSFLFNMSHDIRTPMNAIIGFRDLLEKNIDDPIKRVDYLKKIEDASDVLLSIINNVLEMARIEKGTLEIDETAWSAEQFNDTIYSIFSEMMKQKEIIFTRSINVNHPYVYCDPIKLREIFINILSNAYKYTNSGGSVSMVLEEIPSDQEGYALYRTTISDTGIGISEEFLPHIFEEFSREHNTTDNKIEGTGLGMPIVKRLLGFMGGTIEVHSVKGEGSTFIVTIPHRIAERNDLSDYNGVTVDPALFKDKRILLAEDNDLNAEIAMEILGEAGFIIDRAEDGAICVEKLSKAPANYYDIILMDIQMPFMNGYEATRTIRALQDSAKASIPILAMTANAFEEDKREALRSGMNGHLAKPINVTKLMKALARILG